MAQAELGYETSYDRLLVLAAIGGGGGQRTGANEFDPRDHRQVAVPEVLDLPGVDGKHERKLPPVGIGDEIVNPLHRTDFRFFLVVQPRNRAHGHRAVDVQPVFEIQFLGLHELFEVLAQRLLNILLKLFLGHVLAGFGVGKFLDVALGDEPARSAQSLQRSVAGLMEDVPMPIVIHAKIPGRRLEQQQAAGHVGLEGHSCQILF